MFYILWDVKQIIGHQLFNFFADPHGTLAFQHQDGLNAAVMNMLRRPDSLLQADIADADRSIGKVVFIKNRPDNTAARGWFFVYRQLIGLENMHAFLLMQKIASLYPIADGK